jgi:uncharacterized membrane protein YgdD (TMEM256/DUF423 family)
MTTDRLVAAAAISAAFGIAASAFAAHGAQGLAIDWLKTGGTYQLIHGVAACSLANTHRRPASLLLSGATLFAATLYMMAFGLPRWLGAITPIGGLLMIAGWLWIAYRASSSRNDETSGRDTDLSR